MTTCRKIWMTLATGAALLLFTGQKARAQFIVEDPANLAQNIAQFVQDMAIYFEQSSEIALSFKEYDEKLANFQKYIQMAQNIQKGARYTQNIIRMADYFVDEITLMKNCCEYFIRVGAPATVVISALGCMSDFQDVYKSLTTDSESKMKFLTNIRSGDVTGSLEALNNVIAEYESEFYSADLHFRQQMFELYSRYRLYKQALANGSFMNKRILY